MHLFYICTNPVVVGDGSPGRGAGQGGFIPSKVARWPNLCFDAPLVPSLGCPFPGWAMPVGRPPDTCMFCITTVLRSRNLFREGEIFFHFCPLHHLSHASHNKGNLELLNSSLES